MAALVLILTQDDDERTNERWNEKVLLSGGERDGQKDRQKREGIKKLIRVARMMISVRLMQSTSTAEMKKKNSLRCVFASKRSFCPMSVVTSFFNRPVLQQLEHFQSGTWNLYFRKSYLAAILWISWRGFLFELCSSSSETTQYYYYCH